MKMIVLAGLCLLATAPAYILTDEIKQPAPQCTTDSKADLFLLLDESSSIAKIGFSRLKVYLVNLIRKLIFGPNYIRVSVGLFATKYRLLCTFNSYTTVDEMVALIDSIEQVGGLTYTDLALSTLRTSGVLTDPQYGRRPGVPGVLLIVTDGNSRNRTATCEESDKIGKLGFIRKVITVGSVDKDEALCIAGGDDKSVFKVRSYKALADVTSEIVTAICTVPPPPPATPTCPNPQKIDVYFFCDDSGSIANIGWTRATTFLAKITKSVPVGPNAIQFAMGIFSTTFNPIFNYDTYNNSDDIAQAITSTVKRNGLTFTGKLLNYAWQNGYITGHGRRPDAHLLVFVITDGNSNNMTYAIEVANAFREATRAEMFVLTVGSVNLDEARGIAGNNESVYNVKSFNALDAVGQLLLDKLCGAPSTPHPTTTTAPPPPPPAATAPSTPHPTTTTAPPPPPPPAATAATTQPTSTVSPGEPTCDVNIRADLYFLLDASGSIPYPGWNKLINFIIQLVKTFQTGPDHVQFASSKYSNSWTDLFHFNTYNNRDDIVKAFSAVQKENGGTKTGDALTNVVDNGLLTDPAYGRRIDVPCTFFHVTDGRPDDSDAAQAASKKIRASGCQSYALVIGVSNAAEAELMTGDPKHVMSIKQFNQISTMRNQFLTFICGGNP